MNNCNTAKLKGKNKEKYCMVKKWEIEGDQLRDKFLFFMVGQQIRPVPGNLCMKTNAQEIPEGLSSANGAEGSRCL